MWENPRTASRYMRLVEVVCPATDGDVRVEGASVNQRSEFNDFPPSELSRSGAAFANNPILEQEFKRAELVRKTGDTNGIEVSMGETMKTLIPQTEA